MKKISAPLIGLLSLIIGFYCGRMDKPKFYDGEGNKIPEKVVRLFIESQFVDKTQKEDSILRYYFYAND